MKTLEELFGYLDKRVKVTDTDGKEWTGLCWGVYSAVDNAEDDGVAQDSIEIYDGASATVFYAEDIKSIKIID